MFGVMKSRGACGSKAQIENRRLHYCGTCKTLGRVYGQRSRILLNSDIVFLGEVLNMLSESPMVSKEWDKPYQSYSCLALPKESSALPLHMEYVSAINVLLTQMKVNDHIADTNSFIWKFMRSSMKKSFVKADKYLGSINFPLGLVKQWGDEQIRREKEVAQLHFEKLEEWLEYYSEMTGKITAIAFVEGASLVKSKVDVDFIRDLGFQYGRLIYILDAFKDYKSDFKKGQFNLFRAAFRCNEVDLNEELSRRAVGEIDKAKEKITAKVLQLSDISGDVELYVERLKFNIDFIVKKVLKQPEIKTKVSWVTARKRAKIQLLGINDSVKETKVSFLKVAFLSLSLALLNYFLPAYQDHQPFDVVMAGENNFGTCVCILICICLLAGAGGGAQKYVVSVKKAGPCD